MPSHTRTAAGRAVTAVLMAGLLTGCNHVAKEMEKSIETAVGVPQPKRAAEREVIESYCYQGIGYGADATVACYETSLGPEARNRLMGSTYYGRPAR